MSRSVAHWDFTGLHPPQAAAGYVPLRDPPTAFPVAPLGLPGGNAARLKSLTRFRCPGPAGPFVGENDPPVHFPGPPHPAPYMPLLRITVGGCPSDTSPAASFPALPSHLHSSPLSHRTLPRSMLCGSLGLLLPSSATGGGRIRPPSGGYAIRRINRRTPGFRTAKDSLVHEQNNSTE